MPTCDQCTVPIVEGDLCWQCREIADLMDEVARLRASKKAADALAYACAAGVLDGTVPMLSPVDDAMIAYMGVTHRVEAGVIRKWMAEYEANRGVTTGGNPPNKVR